MEGFMSDKENKSQGSDEVRQQANELMDEIVEIMSEAQERISSKSKDLFTALGGCEGGKRRYPSI
jgi:RNase adaptor protein for sRNA GlmZ degradation